MWLMGASCIDGKHIVAVRTNGLVGLTWGKERGAIQRRRQTRTASWRFLFWTWWMTISFITVAKFVLVAIGSIGPGLMFPRSNMRRGLGAQTKACRTIRWKLSHKRPMAIYG